MLYLSFLLSEFIEAVLVTLAATVYVTYVDTASATFIISSNKITESSTILFKYQLISQMHVLGFQL